MEAKGAVVSGGRAEPPRVVADRGRATGAGPLVDRSLEIETPEHVAIGYELAGPGSRFTAFLIDAVLLTLLLMAVGMAMMVTTVGLVRLGAPLPAVPVLWAMTLLGGFALLWGYFAYFEGLRDGQTPGKKKVGLRVVQRGGFPLTLRDAVIRNLVRVVDVQPWPSCLLGGALIVLHPRAQRLGDLAAGTVVVRERRVASVPEEREEEGPPLLREEEYELLRSYIGRRGYLESDARSRVADRLRAHFASRVPEVDAAGAATADVFLRGLYARESGRRAAAGAEAGSGSPAAASLLRHQRRRWADYEALLSRARRRGLASLPEEEVSRFAALYREVAADLARARTYGASPELLQILERSVGTGHNLLYSRPPRPLRTVWAAARRWLAADFPALVRRRRPVVLAAALLLFAPGIGSFASIASDPGLAPLLVPAEMIARAEGARDRAAEGLGYVDVPEIHMPVFSSQIITNNVQVSFLAFAGGILAGVGTAVLLVLNGVFLGAVAGLFRAEGADLHLWSFVAPHGVIELTAICIAGGAGLWMGSAILVPGRRRRRDALVIRAREAVSLLAGTVVLLVVAGLIEGFISPSTLPDGMKLGFGAVTALLLFPYLALAGREAPEKPGRKAPKSPGRTPDDPG
jgi:uncharacterized membrane protein SpoIIM required for sporulation/uncharacterized RDD family membrane protein YckC